MSYIETETRMKITRRVYRGSEQEVKEFAVLFNGYAYEDFPDCWVVII